MHAEAGQPVETEKLAKPARPSCMWMPAEPTPIGQPETLTRKGAAPPTAALTTKLPVALETVMFGSAAAPAAASAASTSGEPSGSTVRLICVRARAVTFTPGSGKTATTAPPTTNSRAAPAPPVAVRRARLCEAVT